jgi:hypothetical protein
MRNPGVLTNAYMHGKRSPYMKPFQLFLLTNVLFFAVQSFTSTNIFSSTLDSHLQHQDWSTLAQSLVTQRLEGTGKTINQYAPEFNRAAVLNAKSLIIVMVLPLVLVLALLFFRSPQPFITHIVFSLHFHAFLLILFCVVLTIAMLDVAFGGRGLDSDRIDTTLSILNLIACAIYLYFAVGAVYQTHGGERLVKVLLLTLAAAGIVLGYRFVIFLITLYST